MIGNESLHKISNDTGVSVLNFATSKNLTIKSTCSQTVISINLLGPLMMGRHKQINNILIDRRRHSSILHVQSFRAADFDDCDTVHCLVVAKITERLPVSRRTMHSVHME
jgi:hypothetical protein